MAQKMSSSAPTGRAQVNSLLPGCLDEVESQLVGGLGGGGGDRHHHHRLDLHFLGVDRQPLVVVDELPGRLLQTGRQGRHIRGAVDLVGLVVQHGEAPLVAAQPFGPGADRHPDPDVGRHPELVETAQELPARGLHPTGRDIGEHQPGLVGGGAGVGDGLQPPPPQRRGRPDLLGVVDVGHPGGVQHRLPHPGPARQLVGGQRWGRRTGSPGLRRRGSARSGAATAARRR